ncbi:hypothetical protein LPJ53_003088 [Coemansia erecta]|uniref:glucan 1,3-beta-glucosidase n=1 Tax=Coemansia erecta TaxID=147472 RepID=A0A9W7Y2U0_9FUNG|nr:hypothetical protein LPJ53_003088 [Coemansia erecta]
MHVHSIGHLVALVVAHIGWAAAVPAYEPLYQYAGGSGNQALTPPQIAAPLALTGLGQTALSPIANIQPIQFMPGLQIPAVQQQQLGSIDSVLGRPPVGASVGSAPSVDSKAQGSRIQRLHHQDIPGYGVPAVDNMDADKIASIPKMNPGDPVIPFQRRPGVGRLPALQSDALADQLSASTSIPLDAGGWPPHFDATSPPEPSDADDPSTETVSSSSTAEPETSTTSIRVPPPSRKKPVETKKAAPSVISSASAAALKTEKNVPTAVANSCAMTSNTAACSHVPQSVSSAAPENGARAPSVYGSSGSPEAAGVMRVSCNDCHTPIPGTVKTQNVTGDVRQDPGSSMQYHGHRLVRGVNIGGFLVPEFWITPSLVASIPDPKPNDYLQLCNRLGPDATLQLMRRHWETWVSEPEVQRLANSGLTHLRIPIGHWEFVDSDEGYVRGGLPYFKRLVYWAKKYGMRVIPDMHTAPGSQNGFDNSGSTNGINWTKDPRNVETSKRALQTMLRYIASDPVILETVDGIDLLNEPFIDSLDFAQLWEYDTGGHTLIANGLKKMPPVVSIIDRGFKEFNWWQSRWPSDWNSKYVDAFLDAHLYHVFDRNIDNWPLEEHLRLVCQNGRDLKTNSTYFPIIVGEWSLALPQVALQGRENEARRRFAEAQLDAYELGGAGWIFWCFKTEVSPEWSFLEALDRSWIPQPLTSREFAPICPTT